MSGTKLRSKAEGTRLYISCHPEWSEQFVKYHSRVSSVEIARELAGMLPQKSFREDVVSFIIDSPSMVVRILRVVANTEGAFLISIRQAERNFTTESRIVLASSNPRFTRQLGLFLDALGIGHYLTRAGAIIAKHSQIALFSRVVGFSPGIKVVRKKAGLSTWYGCEKASLEKLFFRIVSEQEEARALGLRGAFADCATKEQITRRLRNWYAESNGGGES